MGTGPAVSASLRNFLEMGILGAHSSPDELETLVVGEANSVLACPLVESDEG